MGISKAEAASSFHFRRRRSFNSEFEPVDAAKFQKGLGPTHSSLRRRRTGGRGRTEGRAALKKTSLFTRWGNDGLTFYRLDWDAGRTIGRIPRVLRPLALCCRNALGLCRFYLRGRLRGTPSYLAGRREVFRSLASAVEYINHAGVEGDVAEFGTMSGSSAIVLSRSMSGFHELYGRFSRAGDERFKPRRLHLFDSFEGLPESSSEVDLHSPHVRAGVWGKGTCLGLTPSELRALCGRHLENQEIKIYVGYFNDTLSTLDGGSKLALIHVDCDLYESTKAVLDYCFSNGLLSEGAAVCFDDWNCNLASDGFGERRAWREAVENHHIEYSDWGSYGWAGHKFLVHKYERCK